MLTREEWREIRRLHQEEKVPIKELARRFNRARNTVREALRSEDPPRYGPRRSIGRDCAPRDKVADVDGPRPDPTAVIRSDPSGISVVQTANYATAGSSKIEPAASEIGVLPGVLGNHRTQQVSSDVVNVNRESQ